MATKKQTAKKTAPTPKGWSSENVITVAAFILPLVAWFIAALINPTGWTSKNPGMVLAVLTYLPLMFWPVTLLACICIFAYFHYHKLNAKNVSALLMMTSVIVSAYVFQLTVSASESEFTG